MLFKIDENLPVDVALILNDAGHQAATVWDQKCVGASDPKLAEVLRQEGRAFLTLDLHFADIRAYPPKDFPGLMVLRLKEQDKETVKAMIQRLLPLLEHEPLIGRLWIVDPDKVRIRA